MVLGGFVAEPASDRLFFAIYPDAQAAQGITELAQSVRTRHGLRGKPLRTDRLHVTLHHLGDHAGLPESLVAAARGAAAQVAMSPFDVGFECVASFPGRAGKRPCVLRSEKDDSNAALFALQSTLGERLSAAGLGRCIERRFMPHVTLLYDERTVLPDAVPPIGWRVREFALVHSLLGRSVHRVLGRFDFTNEQG